MQARVEYQKSVSPLRGSIALAGLTQGSQSLALGLTLTAAPQLVECSRLMFDERRLLSLCLWFVHHNRSHKFNAGVNELPRSHTFSRPEPLPVLGGGNKSLDQFRGNEIAFELIQLGQPKVIS